SEEHKTFVPFRNGDFITEDFSRVNGVYYDNETKEAIEEPTEKMEEVRETVYKELELSDEVLYGDLLRFYTPNDEWEPLEPTEYHYRKEYHYQQTYPHITDKVRAHMSVPSLYINDNYFAFSISTPSATTDPSSDFLST